MMLDLGFKLPAMLDATELSFEGAEARARIVRGSSVEAQFHKQTFAQLRPQLLESSDVSVAQYKAFLALHDDSRFAHRTRTTVAV